MITQRRLSKGRARAGRFRAAMALFLAIMSAAAMMSTPVHAEFELKGARVERGEVELEYRGSAHSGLPRAEDGDAPVRQSHDIEYEVGVTDRFAVSAVLTWEELDGFAFEHSATTVEAQFELIDKSYLAVSVLTEVQSARDSSVADEFEIGPVANVWFGKFDILTNTFLTREKGRAAETRGWGLQYDVRARYWQTSRFGYGFELHGDIEELARAGAFESQTHYAGPVLYWNFDMPDETGAPRGPAPKSYGLALGAMIGLTDVTSDAALKVQVNVEF
jgi:hypothetical protein